MAKMGDAEADENRPPVTRHKSAVTHSHTENNILIQPAAFWTGTKHVTYFDEKRTGFKQLFRKTHTATLSSDSKYRNAENRSHSPYPFPLTLYSPRETVFYPMLPDFRSSTAFAKVPRLRPFVLGRATCKWRWVRSIGRMILTGENQSIRGKKSMCLSVHHKSHMDWPGTEPVPLLKYISSRTAR